MLTIMISANKPPLHQLEAWQAAALLARRELSSVDLVRACLARVAEREPQAHAFVRLDADAALDAGPLRGLPFGVKDLFDTVDLPTGYGSPIYAGQQPLADAAVVSLCREAGAVLPGKTVTTELANMFPGATRNPHHPAHTPGGSSSGSTAAVADGMLPLALGTQTAGSLSHERLHHTDKLSAPLRALIAGGLAISGEAHARNLQATARARQQVQTLFGPFDVILAPSSISEAPAWLEGTGDPLFCRG